jgi:hypothetical protein
MLVGGGNTCLVTGALEPLEATWMTTSLMLLTVAESTLSPLRAYFGRLGQWSTWKVRSSSRDLAENG